MKARRALCYIVLILISIMCLFWFYILFINATRSNSGLKTGFSWVPSTYLAHNLKGMFGSSLFKIQYGLLNSLIIAVCSAALCTYFSAMTAYAIHTYNFKFKNAIFTFILAIMMIPTQVTALGFIQWITKLHMMNTFWPLILPSIASPVTFFYMKQYMDSTLPMSLIEAARMDGSSELHTFNVVAMPIMRPAIAVQAIFSFVASWNNYFTPSLVLQSINKKTLPIMIALLRSADFAKFDMGVVYATIAFSIFPVIIVYLLLSKNIVGGVTTGAVKG